MTPDLPQHSTLGDLIRQSAEQFPNRVALSTVDGPPLTYREVYSRVQEIAAMLAGLGVTPHDRVALLSENKPQWGIAYFAITSLGAVAVPILPDFHPREIHNILDHAECRALIVSEKLLPKVKEKEFRNQLGMILLDDFSMLSKEPHHRGKGKTAASKSADSKSLSRVLPSDLASIVYTSGTTGHSKGVMLTHDNILSDALATTAIVDIAFEDRMLSILPLAHTYECTLGLVTPVMVGAAVYYLDKPPSAGVLLPAMAKVKPTIILSVPLIIEKIYKGKIQPQLYGSKLLRGINKISFLRKRLAELAGKKLLSSFGGNVRIFCIGGAPLAADVEAFLREARFPYAIGYGLTETSPLVAGSDPERTKYRSTGPSLPGTDIRIDHPDPVTGEGEILVKGPTVMKGYYKDPERTAEVMTVDGWFHTGDLGMLDSDGYLFIKGRLKNMILGPSGKNIYPEEIESTINEFDFVLESLVFEHQNQLIARAHLNYEKLVHRFSSQNLNEPQVRERMKAILEELRHEVNQRLASFSRLHKIIEQPEPFEKTPTQKIKRHLYHSHAEKSKALQ